ncbi:aromatic amino acid lyase [Thermoleophilia bacterium SCSIO 60948]|nr:aromatic amino acid lyase [Thermoleophilia bacterium SCSIO 60948]
MSVFSQRVPGTVVLDGESLTPAGVLAIARGRAQTEVSEGARERNDAAARLVGELLERGDLLYGVTTGVGALRGAPRSREGAGDHQWRLLRSHAGGGGAPLTVEVVRAAMAVRANQLGAGGAGVSARLLEALEDALAAGVTPFVRELGSLGTGDLTALAEIGLALGGEGLCWVGDDVLPAGEALERNGLDTVTYGPRDGIGFMSSNAVSTGQAALVFADALTLAEAGLGVAALSFAAAGADPRVLDARVHAVRPHAGQVEVARRMRSLLGESARPDPANRPIHDPFVFRCIPQVEGLLFEALEHLRDVLAIELNVAGENALLLPADGEALPNGNFHAGVLTLALDSLRGAMAQSASLTAARVSALLDPQVTGLTPQLARDPGPESGAMILEYTAHAAAAEVRSLAAPAASQTTSVQSGVESHASFAGHSARRTSDALSRMSVVVSAELVLAVRAFMLRGELPAGHPVRALYAAAAAKLDDDLSDRPLSSDLESVRRLLFDDALWMDAEGEEQVERP